MIFQYFRPQAEIRDIASSYYHITIPAEVSDVMRAEIANVRFILKGDVFSDVNGKVEQFPAGCTMLCGPTYKWSNARFTSGTEILGAAIPPSGWMQMFGVPASDFSDCVISVEDVAPKANHRLTRDVHEATNLKAQIEAANTWFASMKNTNRRINWNFLSHATNWLVNPEPNELDDLLSKLDLSHRQIERLCKMYFGSAPKRLHRKFRALHSANRLTWQELSNWRDIATTAYYDQAHFIREFKQFNGRTPSEFINGPHILVRQTLKERLQIDHSSPFSLVG